MNGEKNIKIGVIGLGYVGLPLAVEFSKFFDTIGFDKNKNRIHELKNKIDKTLEVSSDQLKKSRITLTNNKEDISDCNTYIITVPTPVDEFKKPDLKPLESASKTIAKLINRKDIVIYESTVYPGATEDYCVPILEKYSGLVYNKDFFCGYSPERINPGDKKHTLKNIIKITSGSTKEASDFVDSLYNTIIASGTYNAPSITVAEAAKVIENTQRDVNIALMNELAMIFNKLNLDTLEILKAAETKWNFLPFRPGLVGGHCIGVDPYYLTHKAFQVGYNPEIILAGRNINDGMGKYIAKNTITELQKLGLKPKDSKIIIFGLSFKENCPDLRNSKVKNIIENLKKYKCDISIIDYLVDKDDAKGQFGISLSSYDDLIEYDAAILAVGHEKYRNIKLDQWIKILKIKSVFIDVKSIYGKDFFLKTKIKHWRL